LHQLLANKGRISPYNIAGLISEVSEEVATHTYTNVHEY